MSADATELEGYLRRAELLAELGRYEDALTELTAAATLAATDPRVPELCARVRLAADQPEAALADAERLLTAAPDHLPALVVRGHALVDLERYAEAADTADRIIALAPTDPYALTSAAAIRSESRNGQPALDAVWQAVRLAPAEPLGHLVLALVAARLQLSELAERAYREALARDPQLADAVNEMGLGRWQRRRYARALAELVAVEVPASPDQPDLPHELSPRPAGHGWAVPLIGYGALVPILGALAVALLAVGSDLLGRLAALVVAGGAVATVAVLAHRMGISLPLALPALWRADRLLGAAVGAVLASPLGLVGYALLGAPALVIVAMGLAVAAELLLIFRSR